MAPQVSQFTICIFNGNFPYLLHNNLKHWTFQGEMGEYIPEFNIHKSLDIPVSKSDKPLEQEDYAKVWVEFIDGNDTALASLYSFFVEKMYAYGCQLVKNEELVRDSIQDVFCNLIDKRKSISKTVTPRFYLYASLRRRILRQNKRSQLFVHPNEETGFTMEAAPDTLMISGNFSQEQRDILIKAINQLTFRQREAISLYFFEEMSYAEIAEIMSLEKVKSARVLIYRAIESLTKLLGHRKNDLMIFILLSALHH
ncbi:MAG: sigma-70 family RNA polymerase sigma factor [Cyclobacteriaceae bacterium]|nr:sigma-70 family RNA polymerase sigma factor [Cyclobacteriaceae bacterium]